MALVCKKCKIGLAIAKYYPMGGFIGGPVDKDNSGWYRQSEDSDRINEFFVKHKHDYDESMSGGSQYYLGYEDDGLDWKYQPMKLPKGFKFAKGFKVSKEIISES